MAEIEVEESFETTTVRRKTIRQSFKIQEVSNFPEGKRHTLDIILNVLVESTHSS